VFVEKDLVDSGRYVTFASQRRTVESLSREELEAEIKAMNLGPEQADAVRAEWSARREAANPLTSGQRTFAIHDPSPRAP